MQNQKNNLFNLFFESFKSVIIPKIAYIIPLKKYKVVKMTITYSPPVALIYNGYKSEKDHEAHH